MVFENLLDNLNLSALHFTGVIDKILDFSYGLYLVSECKQNTAFNLNIGLCYMWRYFLFFTLTTKDQFYG